MFFGTNREKVLEPFITEPLREFQLRELSRKTKLGLPTIKKHIKYLEKEGFIKKEKGKTYNYHEACRDSREFKIIKIAYTLFNIKKSIDSIVEETRPNTITLFGSAAKGEDTEKGDIDLFVQSKRRSFDFSKTEKKLNRKISILFEPNLNKLSTELLNNLANGITLYGVLEVKK